MGIPLIPPEFPNHTPEVHTDGLQRFEAAIYISFKIAWATNLIIFFLGKLDNILTN